MTSQITIVGNLTGDPELRFTPSGAAVANFTVAVNERVKNQATNEWEDGEGTFYACSAWNEMAENVAESLQKGTRVVVVGGLKGRSYERTDGSKGVSLDVKVDSVGADLRWATAKVTRTPRRENGGQQQGGYSQPQQGGYQQPVPAGAPAGAPAANPWGEPAGGGWAAGGDEPPF